LLAQSKAVTTIQFVNNAAIDTHVIQRAAVDFAHWNAIADENAIKQVLTGKTVQQLEAIQTHLETVVMQESAIHTLAPFLMDAYPGLVAVANGVKKATIALDSAFEATYILNYFADNGNYIHAQFSTDVDDALIGAKAVRDAAARVAAAGVAADMDI